MTLKYDLGSAGSTHHMTYCTTSHGIHAAPHHMASMPHHMWHITPNIASPQVITLFADVLSPNNPRPPGVIMLTKRLVKRNCLWDILLHAQSFGRNKIYGVSQHWGVALLGCPSKKRTYITCKVDILAADDLETPGARVSKSWHIAWSGKIWQSF